MAANRFPSAKREVTGCSDCPMRVSAPEDDSSTCSHPWQHDRDVTGEESVPEFCPLIRSSLVLHLSSEAANG